MITKDQREKFEAWFVKAYHPASLRPVENGCYLNLGAGMAWDAWQAAQPPAPDCRTCEKYRVGFCAAEYEKYDCTNGDQYQPAPNVVLWRTV